jgi:hypothetical protein
MDATFSTNDMKYHFFTLIAFDITLGKNKLHYPSLHITK